MVIAIDLGNSYAKLGCFQQNQLVKSFAKLSLDDLRKIVEQESPDQIVISSVSYKNEVLQELLKSFQGKCLFFENKTPLPIDINYKTKDTLGSDRLAAAMGAHCIFSQQNNLIIDMGSCITYDLLDQNSVYQGGIISPGLNMRFKAMQHFTQRLPLVTFDEILPDLIGKSTLECMKSGVITGLLSEIEGIVQKYSAGLTKFNVLFTGGDALFFESQIKKSNFTKNLPNLKNLVYIPELVLIGLNSILMYNEFLQTKKPIVEA
ncbi:MAG: type III pantothenate kinase [Pseudarcicella sp.]|nr:type III pantothenate kinase [Pseudarcicella sp.]